MSFWELHQAASVIRVIRGIREIVVQAVWLSPHRRQSPAARSLDPASVRTPFITETL